MRWYEATVHRREQTGTDATRNPVYELVETGTKVLVRTAPASPRHEAVEGNRFDMVERTLLTKCDPSLLADAAAVEVGGVLYEIEGVSDWADRGLTVALHVRKAKP